MKSNVSERSAQRDSFPEDQSGRRNWAVLTMIATVEFALGFNLLSVAASIPFLAQDLGGGVIGAGWAMTSYLLVFTGLLTLAGRAGDALGHGRLYLAGMFTYALGALGSALAGSLLLLLAARVLQGAGAAVLSGNGLALTANAFGGHRRSMAVGTVAMATTLGSLTGVVAATFFRDTLGWRGPYLLILPLLLLAFLWAMIAGVPRWPRPAAPPRPWNSISAMALVLGMVALFLSLNHLHGGESSFAAGWQYHTGLQVLALLALVILVVAERRSSSPLFLEPRLAQPAFLSTVLGNLVLHTTMMGVVFLTPFLVESGLGLAAAATGLMLIALHSATPIMNLAGGWVYGRVGPRVGRAGSMLVLAVGFASLGLITPLGRFELVLALSVFISIALGVFVTCNNLVAINVAPLEHRGLATGVLETTRQFGHALSIALVALLIGSTDLHAAQSGLLVAGLSRTFFVMAGFALVGVLVSLPVGKHVVPLVPRSSTAASPARLDLG